ncbi:sugar ABC transporter ATP-binding protein [Xanthobacter sp. V2C-8]|uniref:sugar ABC transporter ATP-binding protein n=1 Tax=Xanthobacter albus TaxID=3119929 RepID=UPI00372CA432
MSVHSNLVTTQATSNQEAGPASCSAPHTSASTEPILVLRHIEKSFPGVKALQDGCLELRAGEVHVLFGENGAGKSTLINIICGVLSRDAGEMRLHGEPITLRNAQDARRRGIAAMFQEFSLAQHLTVEQNLVLGAEPSRFGMIDGRASRASAETALQRYGFEIDLKAVVGELSRAEQQMVEMAKVLCFSPRILILDEPTASLSEKETAALFETVRRLKADGVAIIYITHRMREIDEIADRITIMRDGRYIDTVQVHETSHDRLIELMTGRKVGDLYPEIGHHAGRPILRLERISSQEAGIADIDIELREGEIVGLSGLVGCGKSEIGRTVFGLHKLTEGTIVLDGERLTRTSPRDMLSRSLCYITSDRRGEGLFIGRSTSENITLSALPSPRLSWGGLLRLRQEKLHAQGLAMRMHLRPLNLKSDVINYSGGNQQKIVIARALARGTRVLIFDEPTVGVDVGARAEIYRALSDLVREGCAILLISSDMPEILHLCNRIYVVNHGRIVDHIPQSDASEERLLRGFFLENHPPTTSECAESSR